MIQRYIILEEELLTRVERGGRGDGENGASLLVSDIGNNSPCVEYIAGVDRLY